MAQITVHVATLEACRDLLGLSCPNSIQFLFPGICVVTTKACHSLDFSSLAELCDMTSILCRETLSIANHFDSHRNNFFWSSGVCVAITISCRDLTFFPFTEFYAVTLILCRDTVSVVSQFDPWSQPPFHVETSYLAFRTHASCDSNC